MLHRCLEAPPETERVWGGLCRLSASFRFGEVEHLVKQLEVVVVDDGEVFGDIDICNFVVANVVEGFINITLTELHEIPR